MGQEPDPAKMPLDISAFPVEVQVAFFMFSLLSDTWDGMSGTFLGKDWAHCGHLFELYGIEDQVVTLSFMKMYEITLVNYRLQQQEEKRKQSERKTQAGGKTYTHNVQG